ncbi:isoamylase early set domain-containing protein [Salinispira pacifica]
MDERVRRLTERWTRGAPLSDSELSELEGENAGEGRGLKALLRLARRDRAESDGEAFTRSAGEAPPLELENRIMQAVHREAETARARRPARPSRLRDIPLPSAPSVRKAPSVRRLLQVALPAAVLVLGFLLGVGYARSTGGSAGLPAPDTVTVTFRLAAPEATSVSLVGDFNSWQDDSFKMTDDRHDGVWEITIPLRRGRVYTYNFLIDGDRWISDPDSLYQVKDGFGGEKSVIQL